MTITIHKIHKESDLNKCLKIRHVVFINGQNVPESEEIDGQDNKSSHYLINVNNKPAGTARVRYFDNIAKIERVAILPSIQKMGLGKMLMEYIIDDIKKSEIASTIKLGSQIQVIEFYKKFGFKICSDEYIDAGIVHREMELVIES